jgi:cell division protease FtsH
VNKPPTRQTSIGNVPPGSHAESLTGNEQVRPRGLRDLFNRFRTRTSARRADPLAPFRPPAPWGSLSRRYDRWQLLLLVPLVASVVTVALVITNRDQGPDQVLLSEVIAALDAGEVTSASVDDTARSVTVNLADGSRVRADYPVNYGAELANRVIDRGIDFGSDAADPNPFWQRALFSFTPMLFIVAIVWFLLRGKIGVGGFARGRGTEVDVPATRFADVAGADGAVEELQEVVDFLRSPERFTRTGATAPKGVLLVGPPGTGKTLLARSLAGEAEVPFFALSGSDFVETFVGVGAGRVRKVFDRAKSKGRAIIFIDEIDAIGKARGSGPSNGASEERENTLNQLLVEMDGFTGSGVLVLGATNRSDVLDPALTRPGRFDRTVHVGLPDRMGRTAILEVHTATRTLDDDVDLVSLARRTPGMSGADLEQLVNQASMEAARRSADRITAEHFDTALAITVLGRERRSAVTTDRDRLITAHHEAGHALAALLQDHAEDPVSVTIVPRGGAGGVTWMGGNDNAYLTRREAMARLVVSMAGRAAEERLLDGDFTHGAAGDFQSATRLATQMVTEYGMSRLGVAAVNPDRIWGEEGSAVAAEVRRILDEALDTARALVVAHAPLLDAVVAELMVEETVALADLQRLRRELPPTPVV